MVIRLVAMLLALSAVGCTHVSERYSPSANNVAALRTIGIGDVSVGQFSEAPGVAKTEIPCAAMMISPADNMSFAEYIRSAFIAELKMANMYKEGASTVISAKLTSVNVDASAFSLTGTWSLALELNANGRMLSISDQYSFRSLTLNTTACDGASRRLGDAVQNIIAKAVLSPEFATLLKP